MLENKMLFHASEEKTSALHDNEHNPQMPVRKSYSAPYTNADNVNPRYNDTIIRKNSDNRQLDLNNEVDDLKASIVHIQNTLHQAQDNILTLNSLIRDEFKAQFSQAANSLSHVKKHDEYDTALEQYLRSGLDSELQNLSTKSTEQFRYDGGYSLSRIMKRDLSDELARISVIRKLAYCMEVSANFSELVTIEEEINSRWENESFDDVENTNESLINQKIISIHDLYAQPYISQKLLDDQSISISAILIKKLAMDFAIKEEYAFLHGVDGMPEGILKAVLSENTLIVQGDAGITFDNLLKLYFTLDAKFLANAAFVTNRETLMAIASLTDANQRPLLEYNLSSSVPHALFGIPVYVSPALSFKNERYGILFGDFSTGYTILDKKHLTILRDPFTKKKYVKFFATKEVGGGVTNPKAFALLRVSKS